MSWPPAPTDPALPVPDGLDARGLQPRRIVVVQYGKLGDVLLCTPTVRALRQRYPDAVIHFVVSRSYRAALAGNPDLDEVVVHTSNWQTLRAVRAGGYDLGIDLQGNGWSAALLATAGVKVRVGRTSGRRRDRLLTHAVPAQRSYSAQFRASVLRVLGIEEVCLDLVLELDEEVVARTAEAVAGLPGAGPVVALSPAAAFPTRAWPEARWIELGRSLRERGMRPVVMWGPGEEDLASRIAAASGAHRAPPTRIDELAGWLRACRVHVGCCSGPRHLAVSQRTPTVTVMGATPVGGWTRPTPWHRAVWTEMSCRPCNAKTCDIGVQCLADVGAQPVAEHVVALADRGPEPPLVVRIRG